MGNDRVVLLHVETNELANGTLVFQLTPPGFDHAVGFDDVDLRPNPFDRAVGLKSVDIGVHVFDSRVHHRVLEIFREVEVESNRTPTLLIG